jgi:hypothetical protein
MELAIFPLAWSHPNTFLAIQMRLSLNAVQPVGHATLTAYVW